MMELAVVVGSFYNLLIVRGIVEVSEVLWVVEVFFMVAEG